MQPTNSVARNWDGREGQWPSMAGTIVPPIDIKTSAREFAHWDAS